MSVLDGTAITVSTLNGLEALGMEFECVEEAGPKPLVLKAKGKVTDPQKSSTGHDHKRIAAALRK
jgi:hypothetical protein